MKKYFFMQKQLPSNYPVYVCECVFKKIKNIKLVIHEDKDWQFLCGDEHKSDDLPRVIGLGHVKYFLSNMGEILELENGWQTELINGKWRTTKIDS